MKAALYPLRIALRRVWRYPAHSLLIILASAVTVGGVLCSSRSAAAGKQRVLSQIQRLGANALVVSAQQSRARAGRASTGTLVTTLVEGDLATLRREVPALGPASPLVTRSFRLEGEGFSQTALVVGCTPEFFAIRRWPIEVGVAFDASEERHARRVAVLGAHVARYLFAPSGSAAEVAAAVGQRVTIGKVSFEVVGILPERGQGLDLADEDGEVFIPLRTAMHRLMNLDSYSSILFELPAVNGGGDVGHAVTAILRRRHRTGSAGPDDFTVQRPTALVSAELATAQRLQFLVRWIGASALAVSGLGILAMSWMGIRARTAEIGTRRALGASAESVFTLVLLEAGILSGLGSLAGIGLGQLAALVVSAQSRLVLAASPAVTAVVVTMALGLNFLFALLPARAAARLDPLAALRA